jgi:hypothetical protein
VVLFLTSLRAISLQLPSVVAIAAVVLASDDDEAPAVLPSLRLRLLVWWRHDRLTTFFLHTPRAFFFFFPGGGDDGGLADGDDDELEAKTACGHRAPPPRAEAAMAMSADALMARFLCWRLIVAVAPPTEPEDEMQQQAWRVEIMFLRTKPCWNWKALVLGPRIASLVTVIELEKQVRSSEAV